MEAEFEAIGAFLDRPRDTIAQLARAAQRTAGTGR